MTSNAPAGVDLRASVLPTASPEAPDGACVDTPLRGLVTRAPRMRGVMHQYAFGAAILLAAGLISVAPSARSRVAATVYSLGLCACLGTSAVYHRGRWSHRVKSALCRADHATIFLLIAGTSTPLIMLGLSGPMAAVLLSLEWAGAVVGIAIAVLWRRPPVWVEVGPYLLLGWIGVVALPALGRATGPTGISLFVLGGLFYTVGALCYARERPNPWPRTFGFHEVFHSFVTVAAAAHAALIFVLVAAAS